MNQNIYKHISFISLSVTIAVMVAATIVEKLQGTEFVLDNIYHSPIFFALWAVTAISGLCYIFSVKMQRSPFTLTLHLSFVLILVGALVTHLSGVSGMLHLREGEVAESFELDEGGTAELPFSISLNKFEIQYYPDSKAPMGYSSDVTINGQKQVISMNNIAKIKGYRLYQADFDKDLKGSVLAVSRDPWGIAITYTAYLLLLVSMIGFFFQKESYFKTAASRVKPRVPAIILTACLAGVLIMMRKFIFTGGSQLMPVLRTPLLQVHVISIVLGYFIFFSLLVIGIAGLVVSNGKSEKLRDLSTVLLYPGVFLLTFGTFLGAVWANISWGNYWGWDPKETWALITLLIYSIPLHGRFLGFLRRPKSFHLYCILAFMSVLITYFGVNMLLGGMHSYA